MERRWRGRDAKVCVHFCRDGVDISMFKDCERIGYKQVEMCGETGEWGRCITLFGGSVGKQKSRRVKRM